MSGVVEDWAKTRLACPVTTTQGTRDVVAAIEAAIDQAETLLSHPLFQDVVDQATGELTPVVVVTDNGPAYRWVGFATPLARCLHAPSTPPGANLQAPAVSHS
jgi:putative transposase